MIIENKIEILHSKFYVFQDALVIISILYSKWLDKKLSRILSPHFFSYFFQWLQLSTALEDRDPGTKIAPIQAMQKKKTSKNRHLIFLRFTHPGNENKTDFPQMMYLRASSFGDDFAYLFVKVLGCMKFC